MNQTPNQKNINYGTIQARQELLITLKAYAAEWHIEGNTDLSLEDALEQAFDRLFVDKHHFDEMLNLLKPNSDATIRQTLVKNVMSQSLAFVKGDFHIGDKNLFVFKLENRSTSKYQTLKKPQLNAYLLKRRKILAMIHNQLAQNPCV
jgi:hypothetical protein